MLVLLLVAFLGGALNAVGGGATFLLFPALVFTGVPPLSANVTASVALCPASMATFMAYRRALAAPRRLLLGLAAVTLVGVLIGAFTLLHTPERAFTRIVPYLLLAASAVFTFGKPLADRFAVSKERDGDYPAKERSARGRLFVVAGAQLLIGIYGGYFGAGMGILMLAALSLLSLRDFHAVNALRTLLTVLVNTVASVVFLMSAVVAWRPGLVAMAGAIAGGYGGAAIVRRIDPRWVRAFTIAVAWTLTAYFFARPGS